jgi:hypothetical protein
MAAPAAGQRITAAMLGQVPQNCTQKIGGAQTTSGITMSSSAQDLTGTSVTFTVLYACTALVVATFVATFNSITDLGANPTVKFGGTLVVDGVTQSGRVELNSQYATAAENWTVPLTAGSHTIKLQGFYFGGTPAGAVTTLGTQTKWSALVPSP